MTEILRISAAIATPLALLGLIAALAYYGYSRHLKYEEKKLTSLAPEERARIADQRLTRYGLDASNLTREQKNQLIISEMDKRFKAARLYAFLFAGVFIVCFGLATLAFVSAFRVEKSSSTDPPAGPVSPEKSEIRVSKVVPALKGEKQQKVTVWLSATGPTVYYVDSIEITHVKGTATSPTTGSLLPDATYSFFFEFGKSAKHALVPALVINPADRKEAYFTLGLSPKGFFPDSGGHLDVLLYWHAEDGRHGKLQLGKGR